MLDTLIPDLLLIICQYLQDSTDDICNFCLTCKSCAGIGVQYLVPRLTLVALPGVAKYVSDISNHSGIRHHVKEIVFMPHELGAFNHIEDLVFSDWYSRNHHKMRKWVNTPGKQRFEGLPPLQVLRRYNKLLVLQEKLESKGGFEAMFLEAFTKLPRVRSIKVIPVDRDSTRSLPCIRRCLFYGELALEPVSELPVKRRNYSNKALRYILASARASETRIEELSVTDLDGHSMVQGDATFDELKLCFKDLTRLHLAMRIPRLSVLPYLNYERYLGRGGMNTLLSSSPQLESLVLQFPSYGSEITVAFSEVFNRIVWPRLTNLELSCIETTSEEFIIFMELHAKTLKDLRLVQLMLRGRTRNHWLHIFTRLAVIFNLTNAVFEDMFKAELSTSEYDWIQMNHKMCPGTHDSVGSILSSLIWYSPTEAEQQMYKDTFEDLLDWPQNGGGGAGYRQTIIRHQAFLDHLRCQ